MATYASRRSVIRRSLENEGISLSHVFHGGNPRKPNNRRPTKRTGKMRNSCHFTEGELSNMFRR